MSGFKTIRPLTAKDIQYPPLPTRTAAWALLLDVDGTLIDFASTPDAVHVPPALVALLQKLERLLDGALAFISGRSIAKLDELFAPLQLPCAGLHGVECRNYRGEIERIDIDSTRLQTMREAAYRLSAQLPELLLEDKTYSIAFHFRDAKARQPLLRARLEAIAHAADFSLLAGHYVYELHPLGISKGIALNYLLDDETFRGRLPIFVGDDITDQPAIDAAQQRGGIGIQVGNRITSAARYHLSDPAAVLQWLQQWEAQL